MATINIRVDDYVRDALQEMASEENVTLSEYVRDLLREAVITVSSTEVNERHGDEPAPETLSFMDRKILSLLHHILGRVDPGGEENEGGLEYQIERARVLERGFTGEYWMEVAGFATELSKRDTRRVLDILQMFRIITFSIARHSKAGTPIEPTTANRLEFEGFDHNDPLEYKMATYVEHLIDNRKFSELKNSITENDDGNSHSTMLGVYTRMLAEYRRIMESNERRHSRDEYWLSPAELTAISNARTHPSRSQQK